jgi:tetratricopeptide (TPR) repeat protein
MIRTLFLLTLFLLSQSLFSQEPATNVTVQDQAKVGALITGTGNTINIAQTILPKSQEYAALQVEVAAAKEKLDEKNTELSAAEAAGKSELAIYIRKERDQRAGEYQALLTKLTDFKDDVLRLAETFERLSLNSDRLRTAKALFDQGKIREADAVLNTAEMESETQQLLRQQNRLGQEIAENDSLLNVKAAEWLVKAQITQTRYDLTHWYDSTDYYFRLSLQCRSKAENQFEYAVFLEKHNQLDSALIYYQNAAVEYDNAGDTVNYSLSQNNLGNIYTKQNDYERAAAAYAEAMEIRKRLARSNPATFESDLAATQHNLGILYNNLNNYERAVATYTKALEIRKRLAQSNPATFESDLAKTQLNLGNLYRDQNDYVRATTAYTEALEIYERLAQSNPVTFEYHLATTQDNLGSLYLRQNDYERAAVAYAEALEIRKRLAESNPATFEPEVAMTQNNLGVLYSDQNDYERAMAAYNEALKIYERLAQGNPATFEPAVAQTQNNLGLLYNNQNDYGRATAAYAEALEIRKRLAQNNPAAFEPAVAQTQNNLGLLYSNQNDYERAAATYIEALEIFRRLAQSNPSVYEIEVARSSVLFALSRHQEGKSEEALDLFREALKIADKYPKVPLANSISTLVIQNIGFEAADPVAWNSLQSASEFTAIIEAQPTESDKVEPQEKIVAIGETAYEQHPDNPRIRHFLAQNLGMLSWYYLFAEQYADAEAAAKRGLTIDPAQSWMTTNLVTALVFQGEYSEAEPIYLKLKDQPFDENRTWAVVCLEDLATLEAAGITHPDVELVRQLLKE